MRKKNKMKLLNSTIEGTTIIFEFEGGQTLEVEDWGTGNKEWHLNGKFHREGGPAIEYANGDKEWWRMGKCHRLDGPAVEHSDGGKEWWLNGKQHRENGPAIEWSDGDKEWYLNGKPLTEEEWEEKVRRNKK